MCSDSDQELSDLDIESKTWNKLEKNMKLLGFREGAAKGRDMSLQEGFNKGFMDGFKLGETLGRLKGILSCHQELGISPEGLPPDEYSEISSDQVCVLCLKDRSQGSTRIDTSNFQEVVSAQESHNNKVASNVDKTDQSGHLEKR